MYIYIFFFLTHIVNTHILRERRRALRPSLSLFIPFSFLLSSFSSFPFFFFFFLFSVRFLCSFCFYSHVVLPVDRWISGYRPHSRYHVFPGRVSTEIQVNEAKRRLALYLLSGTRNRVISRSN